MAAVESYRPGNNKPAALFDLDGTLLLLADPLPPGYRRFPIAPWLGYNPEHPAWINSLKAQNVEPYYISAHGPDCHEHYGKTLGLPEFDWVPFTEYGPVEPATRSVAISLLFGMRPVVWFDDEITDKELVWGARRDRLGAPTLLIPTDPELGIQADDMARANQWLGSLGIAYA